MVPARKMWMRSSPGILLACLLSAACATTSVTPTSVALTETDIATIKDINRTVLNKLLVEQDPSALDGAALDQFLVVAPGGRLETKEQAVAGVLSLDVRGFTIADEQVISEGETAVHVARVDIDGTMQPLGKFPPMKMMTTFVKRNDEWRMLSRAMTVCAAVALKHGVC